MDKAKTKKKERKQTTTSASLISLRIANSTRVSPSDESQSTVESSVDQAEHVHEHPIQTVRAVQATQESQ